MEQSWQVILHQIEEWQEESRKGGYPLWYRGHRLSDWPLQTSLHRRVEANLKAVGQSFDEETKIEMMRDVYKTLYRKFKARAWHLLSLREMSDWGIIFSMQHHGVPTRLLDWTESFVCALYFAHYGRQPSEDAAIFILNPEHLNAANFGYEGQVALGEDIGPAILDLVPYHPAYVSSVRVPHTIAVAPILSNPRMLAQQSAFTLGGDPFQPLDERYGNFVKKIVLPPGTFNDSKRLLDLVGIGHFGYFPDFEGLRNELIGDLDKEVEIAKELFSGDGAV